MKNTILKRCVGVAISMAAFAVVANADHHQSLSIDMKKSEFTWKANKKVGSGHYGNISLKSAKAEMDKEMLTSAEFEMDMNSFTVTDLEGEWKTKFMSHVKSGDFFEVDKYPTAKLTLNKQVKKGSVDGTLTIKEKTQPVTVEFSQKDGFYIGTLSFDRTKFGITYNSENFFKVAADKIIQDKVTLDFKVAATAPKAAAKSKK